MRRTAISAPDTPFTFDASRRAAWGKAGGDVLYVRVATCVNVSVVRARVRMCVCVRE